MPDRVGQQLGNYRLLRLLGRGGQASVYLGEHVYLKRRAALKVLHTSLEDEAVEQFLAEAQTLARLDHPNIVRVSDFAVEGGTPFLVMDYAPRGTFRTLHPPGTCLSLETTITYTKQVTAALQYAHNHQVIHRDVKPENMLLGPRQEVLLSDFGISLFAPSPEQLSTQEMSGTLPYMAPEQIRGKPVFASDQYSLGIIVYEWLCGVRPFAGSPWQVVSQQVSDPPPPLREHDPSLPQAVEDVVLKALAKDPRDRFVSVSLFAQALERACQEQPLDLSSENDVTAPLGHLSPAPPFNPAVVPRRVFVVAAQAEDAFVARLTTDMQRRGVVCWQEGSDGTGQMHEQEHLLRQAIRAVEVVLVVVSSSTASSRTVKASLRIASLYQRRLVFVWVAGEEIADVLSLAWDNKMVQIDLVDAREEPYEEALEELLAFLEAETPLEEFTLPEPVAEPRNPYKGLRAYLQADAADFFGRDRLIEELVERMKALVTVEPPGMPTARLLSVIGPSGSGKSSVVMAGLLPRLQQGVLPGSEQWVYLEPMVPGIHPLEALALTLAPQLPNRSLKNLHEDVEDGSARGLHLLAKQLSTTAEQKVMLLVDQFEELFTLTTSEEERQQFIDLLTTAVTELQGGVIVLLTLRADFYDRPMAYPTLQQLLETHQKSVLPMEVADLRAVIRRPAALPDVQLSFEGNVVGDLLFEVQGQVGALPLLQFTLEQLFERRDGHTLTLQAYREIGGVKGALARYSELTYAALPSEEHRRLARALFLRLIDLGANELDTTRRRAALSELSLPDPAQTTMLRETADAFVAARLLTTNTIAGTPTLEVSHEALIREWTRLAEWLGTNRNDILLQKAISQDAAEWIRHDRPADRLYRGTELTEAQAWAERNMPSLNEVAFLQASVAKREQQETEERLRQARELDLQRRAANRQRYVIGLMAVTSVVLVVALVVTLVLQGQVQDKNKQLQEAFTNLQRTLPPSVTNLNDSGPGSLRQAVATAAPDSAITFARNLKGTIILTSGELKITKNVLINGPGANALTIDGGNSSRVFHVSEGVLVIISNLTIKDGKAISSVNVFEGGGGGIYNSRNSTLVLANSVIESNTAYPYGGGISNFGTLTLSDSIVLGNKIKSGTTGDGSNILTMLIRNIPLSGGDNSGGGIYSSGNLTLVNSRVVRNSSGLGGGITSFGTTNFINSTVSDNTSAAYGGGVFSDGFFTLINSTVSGNRSTDPVDGFGGGIFNYGSLNLTNSTISGNEANLGGGGIENEGGDVAISNCTIYNNTARKGGGIGNGTLFGVEGPVKISDSILAGDHADTGSDILGTLTLDDYNLIQDIIGATLDNNSTNQHNLLGPSPSLNALHIGIGPLQNNGGLTQTHALLPGSPAIDQIPLAACHIKVTDPSLGPIATTDQRGMKRPDGNEQFCDIGTYEYSDGPAGSALSGSNPLYEGDEKSTLIFHLVLVQSRRTWQ
jgi:tRNA A-37 threonylcarbamoyl transferase component Bud32